MTFESINPYDGHVMDTNDTMTEADLDSAISKAQDCFEVWKLKTYKDRATFVQKAADLMRLNVDALAEIITLEMGKLIAEARGEVLLSANILEYYAVNAETFLAPQKLTPSSGEAAVTNSPIGIIFGIEPWNFPYYQLARFAAPNLMAGNVVMIKPAENVPQCGLAFEKIWRDAGAPDGAYTNLMISKDQAGDLIDNPMIKGVALTGSVAAGKIVSARAAHNLKKSIMELGGSDAFIVLADADIDKTVKWAVWAKMNNTGQCCVAGKRFIILDTIADEFLEKFKVALSQLKSGDPMDADTTIGPLCTEAALDKIIAQVKMATNNGAKLVMGGERMDRKGAFMQPTILTHITPDNPAFLEEFFGPVALFFPVKNEEEAIALANNSEFGLGGSIFTKDIEHAKELAHQIDTGMVFINHPTWTQADLPFGGTKNSGYGRELSSMGIQEFVNKKLIRIESIDNPA
jgi:succinate-semialdehyde dehydrogenase/glutarate-semialdehyde dehydrogenase